MMPLRFIFVFTAIIQLCPTIFPCINQSEACSLSVSNYDRLCMGEQAFISARAPAVKSAIKKFVGLKKQIEKEFPSISICISGGGYRAMIAGTGFMLGASEIGLTDASTYISSLSGSTWFILNFLLRKKIENIDIKAFRDRLKSRVTVPFLDPGKIKIADFLDRMLAVFVSRGKIEPADAYGALFADRLWGDLNNSQKFTFSDISDLFKDGSFNFPFPIFTLILSDVFPYEWLDVTPFSTGSDYLDAYIPTSAFDSKFYAGKCTASFPEQSLGWFAGMFGSAYNFSLGDAFIFLARELKDPWLTGLMYKIVDQYYLYESRLLPSPVNNFVYNFGSTPLSVSSEFEISDAGVSFCIPFPPVLKEERNSDIIIVCDASANASTKDYPELRYAAAYMKRKGIKFPKLDAPKEISDYVSVFEDETDKNVPTIIYFANPVYVPTRVFTYSPEEYDEMCDSMKKLVIEHKQVISDTILRKIELA